MGGGPVNFGGAVEKESVLRIIILLKAASILCIGLLAWPVVRGQSQISEEPKFQIEIQANADGGPKFTVTNLSSKTLTACVIQLSVSSQSKRASKTVWDALAQGGRDEGRGAQQPLGPGASMTMYLSHEVGGPLPDKVEVIAGVWADGETSGEPDWVKVILGNRASLASAYEEAISLLQLGLDQHWTRDQYLDAIKSRPNSLPNYSIRRTLETNQNLDQKPRLLQHAVQNLLEHFTQRLATLRQAKPPAQDAKPE